MRGEKVILVGSDDPLLTREKAAERLHILIHPSNVPNLTHAGHVVQPAHMTYSPIARPHAWLKADMRQTGNLCRHRSPEEYMSTSLSEYSSRK